MGVAGRVVCADILDLSTVQSVPANDLEQIKEKRCANRVVCSVLFRSPFCTSLARRENP